MSRSKLKLENVGGFNRRKFHPKFLNLRRYSTSSYCHAWKYVRAMIVCISFLSIKLKFELFIYFFNDFLFLG